MAVRAKFKVDSIDRNVNSENEEETVNIRLTPVISGSEENETFYKYTPGGAIVLSVVNPAAAEQFVQDGEYYVDFTPAEA